MVTAVCAGLMGVVAAWMPGVAISVPGRTAIAIAFGVAGGAVALAGVVAFRRASTTVNPLRPEGVSSLVTSGIYRVTRNPMYLGFLLALIGWAIWLGHPLSALMVPLFVAYMSRFQIGPEERVLRAQFGDAFGAYSATTRRWV